jgi:reactive intermediate/imine deaminase
MLKRIRCSRAPLALALLLAMPTDAAERKSIFPPSAKPVGPYSPGIMAGDYLYVSGQGARDSSGNMPASVEEQTANCLNNIKTIVEAAGLTMDHVVYTHTYLTDIKSYAAMNTAYAKFFPNDLPARSTMGVARMPVDTPVEISAVAIRDRAVKKIVVLPNTKARVPISPGVLTPDRFFISGILGRDAEKNFTPPGAEDQIRTVASRLTNVLSVAGIAPKNLVHINVYRTADMPSPLVDAAIRKFAPDTAISLIAVTSLPFEVKIGITGVAVRDFTQKKTYRVAGKTTCAAAGETVYCAVREAADVTTGLDEINTGLKVLGTDLSRAVANNVYIDDIDRFAVMNASYGKAFPSPAPTRTTVQPIKGATVTGVSVVAVR